MMGLGQWPASGGQPGLDPVDVGLLRLLVGDLDDGAPDRLRGLWLALVREFLRDRADLAVGQLAAQQGEKRDVIDVGHSLGIARPPPFDDLAQNRRQRHALKSSRWGAEDRAASG